MSNGAEEEMALKKWKKINISTKRIFATDLDKQK